MTPPLPETIELHFANTCTGNCVVCSKAHGHDRQHFVSGDVVTATIGRLQETGKEDYNLQLGGDGDSFLHPHFLDHVARLKRALPGCHRCLYTSAFSLTPERSNRIVRGQLINQIEVRIDSLRPTLYYQSTGMFLSVVRANLEYFARINDCTDLCLIYMPLYRYRAMCEAALGKPPTYLGRLDPALMRDEWSDVLQFAKGLNGPIAKGLTGPRPVAARVTGISLWAERTDCKFSDYPCPRLPENQPGDMLRQLYIYPDGSYGLCGYDDGQDTFLLGNVFDDSIEDVWNGDKMHDYMSQIRNRTADNHPVCCVNPRACRMWDEVPA